MRVAVLLLLAACGDSFETPPEPDLYKPPIDFAPPSPPRDLGVPDMPPEPDLAMPIDLASSD
jgi:hypothetical protein